MGGEGGRRRKKSWTRNVNWTQFGKGNSTIVESLASFVGVSANIHMLSTRLYVYTSLSLSLCLPACVSACNCFCLAIPGVLQTIMRLLMVSASSPVSARHSTSPGKAVKNFGLRTDAVLLIKSHVILSYRLCWVMASISLIEKRAATKSGFYTWQTASLLPHPPAFRFYINENCNFETPEPNDMNMGHDQGLYNIDGTWLRFWGLNKLPIGNSSCCYSSYHLLHCGCCCHYWLLPADVGIFGIIRICPSAVCGAGSCAVSTRSITDCPSVWLSLSPFVCLGHC